MNKYSIKTTILIYMSLSAALLILALGIFVIFNHTKSLKNDLVNKMHIMTDDIIEHNLFDLSPQDLRDFFASNKSNHTDSYGAFIKEIDFTYVKSLDSNFTKLSVAKELPNGMFIVISSSPEYINEKINKLLLRLVIGLITLFSLIMLGLYLLLKKLLFPLECLVEYCNNSSIQTEILPSCIGSYEVNSMQEAILGLQKSNHKLCKEKQDIFKEAAHEIKTPIAILKARLALFGKSDMLKDEFIEESMNDISRISNKLRELIFLKAIEWDIRKAKESVRMQNQCSIMQQLFRPILEKKELQMVSNLQEDFTLYIHREAIDRVMQAVFENIFMHTKNGTTITTNIDSIKHELSIINEIGEHSDEILFSSHIGSQLIQRLSDKLEYEYSTYEKNGFYHTKIVFKGQLP